MSKLKLHCDAQGNIIKYEQHNEMIEENEDQVDIEELEDIDEVMDQDNPYPKLKNGSANVIKIMHDLKMSAVDALKAYTDIEIQDEDSMLIYIQGDGRCIFPSRPIDICYDQISSVHVACEILYVNGILTTEEKNEILQLIIEEYEGVEE